MQAVVRLGFMALMLTGYQVMSADAHPSRVEPAGGPPQVLSKLVASEVRKWSKVIADAGIPRE